MFNKENIPYGSEAIIFQDTKEISSIGLSSSDGIVATNFLVSNSLLSLRNNKVYFKGKYEDYNTLGSYQYFFTIELYALKK